MFGSMKRTGIIKKRAHNVIIKHKGGVLKMRSHHVPQDLNLHG